VLVVDSLRVREETNGTHTYIDPRSGKLYSAQAPVTAKDEKLSIYEKNVNQCPLCKTSWTELREVCFTERYHPLLISGHCQQHGPFLKQADERDLSQIERAKEFVKNNISLPNDSLIIPEGPKSSDLLKRGVKSYADLFTARQQIYISKCRDFLAELPEPHRLWLSLLVSTSLEFNSLLCGYKGTDRNRAGAIRHVFSHHAYSFPHTALENNPLFSGSTSGTIGLLFQDRIQNAAIWAQNPIERKFHKGNWLKTVIYGESDTGTPVDSLEALRAKPKTFCVQQQDSSQIPLPDNSVDHIVTDPPYYDSVQYSDLAHFFRAWLKWFLPQNADWEYDVKNSAVAESEQDGQKYQKAMTAIWQECQRVLIKPSGRLIFTFHHWKPEAWAYLTLSLKSAGLHLLTHYVVQSENPISVHIRQLNALKHDAILVLCPTKDLTGVRAFPSQITSKDSFSFCDQCATFLGYCLDVDAGDQHIMQLWKEAMGNL
jgi:adenine-specific DNA methylase